MRRLSMFNNVGLNGYFIGVGSLIDEHQFVVNPVVLGVGRTLFEGLGKSLTIRLTESRAFKSGKLFLRYEPIS